MNLFARAAQLARVSTSSFGEERGVRPFVLLFTARSGSSYLVTKLNSHPDVLCHFEACSDQAIYHQFGDRAPDWNPYAERRKEKRELRDGNRYAFLKMLYCSDGTYPNRDIVKEHCIGFKLLPSQGRALFAALCTNRCVKKIVLRRRNLLEQYISLRIAHRSNQWIHLSGSLPREPEPPIEIPPTRFFMYVWLNALLYHFVFSALRLLRQPHVEIVYEELDDERVQQELLTFLGVEQRALVGRTQKQAVGEMHERVANWSELERSVRTSRYSWMLPPEQG